jgi:hypothetical protein
VNTLSKDSVATETLPTKCVVSQWPSPVVAEVCYSRLSRNDAGSNIQAFRRHVTILFSHLRLSLPSDSSSPHACYKAGRRFSLDFIIPIISGGTIDSYTNRGVITEQFETDILFHLGPFSTKYVAMRLLDGHRCACLYIAY